MTKERIQSDEEIDNLNRELEQIFDKMPAEEIERHLAEARNPSAAWKLLRCAMDVLHKD
jgi:hypothetical protein